MYRVCEAAGEIAGRFWRQHPALFYALGMLLGVQAALQRALYGFQTEQLILILPLGLLAFPLFLPAAMRSEGIHKRVILMLVIACTSFFYVEYTYRFPRLPPEGLDGLAQIEIHALSSSRTPFAKTWTYKGNLVAFKTTQEGALPKTWEGGGETLARNLPFRLSLPQNESTIRPKADRDYIVRARLKEITPGNYRLSPHKNMPWQSIQGTYSLAEQRFWAKTQLSAYIHRQIHGQAKANFLAGIATGDFDDRQLSVELSRFGLQHIMAISGFHFGIIAAILGFFLRFAFPKKYTPFVLIGLLTAYFLFLGCGPSIMRAWITIVVLLMGYIGQRQSFALNSLGLALLIVLFIDPLQCQNLGFQFSFLITAAILLFYSPCAKGLQYLWRKRSLSQMVDMTWIDQHGYLLLIFIKQALALAIAVNLIAFPMTLYIFHKFPWLSLAYNLFFPFLVSFAMLLLLLALASSVCLPPLADLLHALNNAYTGFLLNFVYNTPTSFDFYFRVSSFAFPLYMLYMCLVFAGGVVVRHRMEQRDESLAEFAFL